MYSKGVCILNKTDCDCEGKDQGFHRLWCPHIMPPPGPSTLSLLIQANEFIDKLLLEKKALLSKIEELESRLHE